MTLDAELTYPNAGLQDLIIKFEPHDFFNVWAGKMILPIDRANLSGPWFTNYWLMRGAFPRTVALSPPPYGIKAGPFGRQQGVTAWGQFWGGMLKYFAGAYELDQQSMDAHPMYAGRLVANFLDPEPGYYNESAYHGEKDIISIGVGGQYQKGGSVLVIPAADPDLEVGDLKVFTADLLIDKKLGDHVLTLEGSVLPHGRFPAGQPAVRRRRRLHLPAGRSGTDLARGALPECDRAGGLRPVAMTGIREVGLDREFTQVDGYVQYLIKSNFAKVMLGGFWTRTRLKSAVPTDPSIIAKGIQIGLQLIAL